MEKIEITNEIINQLYEMINIPIDFDSENPVLNDFCDHEDVDKFVELFSGKTIEFSSQWFKDNREELESIGCGMTKTICGTMIWAYLMIKCKSEAAHKFDKKLFWSETSVETMLEFLDKIMKK